jgi:hypothetical protein
VKSTLIDGTGKSHEVKQVFLWEGERKTSASDAGRGMPVESNRSVTVEMIFKGIPPATKVIKSLNLHSYTAIRLIVFKWSEADLSFKNIGIRK